MSTQDKPTTDTTSISTTEKHSGLSPEDEHCRAQQTGDIFAGGPHSDL
ncbi:hypothetical protein [Salinibaculum rarum]|nr:hypothetical protein [Salinibaculum sp. KK48]